MNQKFRSTDGVMVRRRYTLRDDHWERLKERLSGRVETAGVTAEDNWSLAEAVLYSYRSGSTCRDLLECFGDWKNVHRRFSPWAQRRV